MDDYERKQVIEKATSELVKALTPVADDVREALIKLAMFRPEGGEWWGIKKRGNDFYSKGDESAPLISESFTYWLCGKEDGRTLLSRFNTVCRALNLDPHEIRDEAYRRLNAEDVKAMNDLRVKHGAPK